MKKNYSIIALSVLAGLFLFSCKTSQVFTINITEPAPVFLDSSYKKVAVLNRTEPDAKNKPLEILDKVLTMEGKDFDKEGAETSTRGTADELIKNPRFNKVVVIDSTNLTTPGMGIFPASIPWDKLEKIADKNDVEVIFVLSFYDTDTKIDYSNRPVEVKNPLGIKVKAIEHKAIIDTRIKSGWRIYDVRNREIKDEIILTDRTKSVGRGINPAKALESVVNRKENVLEVSNYLGHDFGKRVIQQDFIVERRIYVRGSDNLKAARRYINAGDWNQAEKLWKRDARSSKRKIAGRATFNLAIISEINGNLEKAILWANKSYIEHNNKKALVYLNILKERMEKERELEEQLNN